MMNSAAGRSALLVMDFQQMIVDMIQEPATLLNNTASVIAAARAATIPVIHVVVGFRPGAPEVSPRNKSFSAAKAAGRFDADNPKITIHDQLAPSDGGIIVTKHRIGAFQGTDLDMILRAADIDTLVLCGISTSGVVLSTLRFAADADYGIVVLRDCCADADAEVHRVLMEKVFPRQADVKSAADFIGSIS